MGLGNEESGLELQVIIEGEGVVVVLRDSCRGGAAVEELELEGFVKVVASVVELVADEDTGGAAVYEGGKYFERAAKSDIDDE
ncbi:hypothetical protein C0989_009153 [Termitomyces sp. Mn162]|nr:hypothetical protein C0989_009153 [Termitomyces sp. Mn162]